MKKPLNYAILLYFTEHTEGDADEIIEALKPEYEKYRNFKKPAVIESLMTAKENGLLEESDRVELTDKDELRVWYKLSEYGDEMIRKYL